MTNESLPDHMMLSNECTSSLSVDSSLCFLCKEMLLFRFNSYFTSTLSSSSVSIAVVVQFSSVLAFFLGGRFAVDEASGVFWRLLDVAQHSAELRLSSTGRTGQYSRK